MMQAMPHDTMRSQWGKDGKDPKRQRPAWSVKDIAEKYLVTVKDVRKALSGNVEPVERASKSKTAAKYYDIGEVAKFWDSRKQ